MMRSLFAAVSGLRNHQTRMDVIGNNISNVNTVGYKASRVTFEESLSQLIQSASRAPNGASGTPGGTNPVQVGLGMRISSIDQVFTQGNLEATGQTTDLDLRIELAGYADLRAEQAEVDLDRGRVGRHARHQDTRLTQCLFSPLAFNF